MKNLSKNSKITKLDATQGAAASDYNGGILDMQGYEGVVFLASLGTAAADNGLKVQQGAASNLSDAADLLGTQLLSDGTQTDLVTEIIKPLERYVRPVVIRGTSSTIEAIWAIQYGNRKGAVNNATTAQAVEIHSSPAEGTA